MTAKPKNKCCDNCKDFNFKEKKPYCSIVECECHSPKMAKPKDIKMKLCSNLLLHNIENLYYPTKCKICKKNIKKLIENDIKAEG